ncbi:hypothetical protein H0H87_010499 [Tephrocybe sp. NHM501043]|nr:hypothetical protein H0H87_010499 [Tephrocybe sp. NHM501043]
MDQPRPGQASQQQQQDWDPASYEQSTYQNQNVPYAATRPFSHSHSSHTNTPAQQPAYYDPNPAEAPPVTLGGYDTEPINGPNDTTTTTTTTARGGLTSPPIDGGKLGLLPKRPVTLLQPTQVQRQHSQDDSDDGLEYAESPFEETRPGGGTKSK